MSKIANLDTGEESRLATDRSRWIALIVLCVGALKIMIDLTIVNVALPSIRHDLHFTPTDLSWVINAYLISFAGSLLLAGRVGDFVGRRDMFLAGLATFVAASTVCVAAQSQAVVVTARFLQGLGGGWHQPSSSG